MNTITHRNRGVTSLLAMMYMVLFATLALGFFAATTTSSQVAGNDEQAMRAMLACESGASFMRFQMAAMDLPYGTNNANLMTNAVAALGANLNDTPNMGGKTVAITGGVIYLPSQTTWMTLDPASKMRFRAEIRQTPGTSTLAVTVRGAAASSSISRGVQLNFEDESMPAYAEPANGAYFQISTPQGLVERSESLAERGLPAVEAPAFVDVPVDQPRILAAAAIEGPFEPRAA